MLDDGKDAREYQLELFLICPKNNQTLPDTYVERYDNPSPMPYIHKINQLGRVIVRFNDTMIVPLTSTERQYNQKKEDEYA